MQGDAAGTAVCRHTSTAATAVYARLNLDPVRQAVTVTTDAILAAGKKPAEPEKLTGEQPAGARGRSPAT